MGMWVLILLVTMLASCSGERSPDSAATGKASPAPTERDFVSGGDCPSAVDPELPARSGCVSVVRHGVLELVVYALLDQEDRPRKWWVQLTGPDQEVIQRLDVGSDYPRAQGASDVDGDGRYEWWIRMGDYASHGATWGYMNLFFFERGELVPLTFEGRPLAVNYGGISRLGEGAECRNDNLILLRAEAQDVRNTRWDTSERTLSIEDHEAVLLSHEQHTVVVDSYVDPRIRRYFRVECRGDVFLPF